MRTAILGRRFLCAATPTLIVALGAPALADPTPVPEPARLLTGDEAIGIRPAHDLRPIGSPQEDAERGVPVVIYSQNGIPVAGANAQVMPDLPNFSAHPFDDFRTTRTFQLDQCILAGFEQGDPLCNQGVIAEIWQGRPGFGGFPVIIGTGVQVGDDLQVSFGGQLLPPGDYLITAYVDRPFNSPCNGGQFFLLATNEVHGREGGIWNPGGGFGWGPDIGKMSDIAIPDGPPLDLNFTLFGFPNDFQDCNLNGTDDFTDIADGTSFDTNLNGIPDECERNSGDWDIDGIPDFDDPLPNVYSEPEDDASSVKTEITQLSLASTPIWQAAPLTEHGAVRVTFPTIPDKDLYVNIEVNGQWAVQNQHTFTTERRDAEPTQTEVYYIDLGNPRGTPVTGASVRIWVDPIGMTVLPPGTGPLVPVTEGEFRIGGGGPGVADPVVVPPAVAGPAAPAPMPVEVKTTVENEGLEVADLKYSFERNSCGPNSVGGSFEWMLRTYKLMLPASVDSVDELVQEFRVLMNTLLGKSTTDVQMKAAKEGFIRKHMLPLTVESGNVGVANRLDTLITPEQIFKEVEKGQDVEILYGMWKKDPSDGNKWKRHGGHFVAIKSVTKCVKGGVTTWKITWRHDWRQSQCGGVDDVTVGATSEANDLDNDGTNETGWVLDNTPFADGTVKRVLESYVAESPTLSQLIKAIGEHFTDYDIARTAALGDGTIDLAEAKNLLKLTEQRKKLWMRLLATAKAKMPPDPVIINAAERALQSICNVRDIYAKMVKDLSKSGRSVLPEADLDLILFEDDSVSMVDYPAVVGANPPDADFDDVTDASDNAPLDANPDQADQDGNFVPDVLELSAITDCDDNGIIDSYEITIDAVIDYLLDGTEVHGFVFDLDGNLIPDRCETVPPTECKADFDGDFDVDVFDFGILAANFGSVVYPGTNGDLDLDGMVTVFDFALFAVEFGCVP